MGPGDPDNEGLLGRHGWARAGAAFVPGDAQCHSGAAHKPAAAAAAAAVAATGNVRVLDGGWAAAAMHTYALDSCGTWVA